jgi:hypothetical protein
MKKFALIALLVSGCGVSTQHVENKPPVIHRDLVQLAVTYGTFKVNQVSVFLWPANLTEEKAQELVRTVNSASEAADPFMVKAAILGAEAAGLQIQWDQISCIEKYAVLQPGQDPIDVDQVTEWKADKDVPDKAQQVERDLCVQNQTRRLAIPAEQDAARQSALPFLAKIMLAIDPDQTHIENSKALDVTGTRITLHADSAPSVSLGNFLFPGYGPSVENGKILNASYDPSVHVLSFDVPDVDANLEPTGLMYHFAMERGNDHGPLARFTGDMNLMNGSKIVRYGSARFDAFPPQQ